MGEHHIGTSRAVLHPDVELGTQQGSPADVARHVMKPMTAPKEPYVSLNVPKFAAYQENRADTPSHRTAASALPEVNDRHRDAPRLGP